MSTYPGPDVAHEYIAPAGAHSSGARQDQKRFADITKGFYHWMRKRLPTPGAQNYAFESLGLIEQTPIGPSILVGYTFKKTQPAQSYMPNEGIFIAGLGGLVAGQIALQGLYDPNTQTFAGQPIK